MTDINNLITDNIDVWTNAVQFGSSSGRGKSKKLTLHGVKKLRDLILELAVHGKLVPQLPNEEPASMLLERMANEKSILIKEKRIKKPKNLPELTNEDIPYSVPKSWSWCRLQDISSYIQRGKSPKYDDIGKVKVISQKCIQWSGFDIEPARFVDDESLEKYQDERYLQPNDLLWNSTGTGTVGRINVLEKVKEKTLVADSHVTVIRSLLLNPHFIWVYISAPGIQARIEPEHENALVSGSTKQVELNTSSVVALEIPLPPEEEQNRIVEKVEELMTLCDQLEQQTETSIVAHQLLVEELLSTLTNSKDAQEFDQSWARIAEHFDLLFATEHSIEQLKQTILQLAVMGKLVPQDPTAEPASKLLVKIAQEKEQLIKDKVIKKQKALPVISDDSLPFKVPKSWKWVHWNDLLAHDDAAFKRGPFGSSLKKDMFVPSGYKVYEQYCPINDDCSFERYFITPEKFEELKGFAVKAKDYLVSCSGVTLGRITQVPKEFKEGVINQAILRVRMNTDYIDSEFFKIMFRSPYFQKAIFANSTGSAIPNVKGVKELKAMLVPFMNIHEQKKIVDKVNNLFDLCDRLKSSLIEANYNQILLSKVIVEQALK